jgi:uncharacterized membrane protein
MAHLSLFLQEAALTIRPHRSWMTWNLLLALVPALLAVALFALPHRRRPAWWIGIVVFILTLPNAPYVVTDLVHLRHSVSNAASDGLVVGVVLPLYTAFILAGFLAYVLCTELVTREVRAVRPGTPRWLVEAALHVTCTVGILVGRIARLNSWDTVTDPANTVERTFETLTWRWAPAAFVLVLAAVWLTHVVVRTLASATATAGRDTWRHLQTVPT